MGFFSKKKEENNGFIINFDDEPIKISGDKNLAPHAMTPDEVSGLWIFGDENQQYEKTNALDSLKKRMNASDSVLEKSSEATVKPAPQTEMPEKVEVKAEPKADIAPAVNVTVEKTLVEKVKRYTIDEKGHDVTETQKPLYELESVAEILKSSSENAMKNLSKKYGLDFVVDDLGKKTTPKPAPVVEEKKTEFTPPKDMNNVTPTPAFEQMVNDAEARESRKIYENLFETEQKKELPDISIPDISDIDNKEVGISNENPISNTSTIRFTPVKDTKGNTDHITISSVTKHIDLGDNVMEDISSFSTPQLEHTDFDDFEPQVEYVDTKSGKQILKSLAKKKRSYFIGAILSVISLIALSFFFLPSLHDLILANPKSAMLTCSAFLFISIAANVDMFLDFKNLLDKRAGFDIMAAFYSVTTLSLGLTAAFTGYDAFMLIFLCALTLVIRVILKFCVISAKQRSLKS